jgi:mono/diheme cytochrome c family protein
MKCFTPFTRPLGVVFGMAAFGVALAATPSDVARGKKLFSEKNCNVCHSVAGKGGKFALDNVGAKRDAEWLLVQLKNPKAHNPMSMMPPTQGSDQELKSLVAYLTTLKPAGASAPSPANQTPSKGRFLARPKTVGPIVTGKPVDVEFTLGDTTRTDTVTGPAPVVRAKVTARVTMPSMPGMPELKASVHAEDQPGLYGLKTTFPHGGEYLVALTVQPSTGRAETSSFTLIVGNAVPGASATGTAATGQAAAPPTQGAGSAQPSPSKGRYSLRLRLPEDGVFAEEEMDVE